MFTEGSSVSAAVEHASAGASERVRPRALELILRETLDPSRVHRRDAKSYCAILFDYDNRKPIARLYFNRANKQRGIFDKDKERHPLERVDDLFKLGEQLKAVAAAYAGAATEEAPAHEQGSAT